MKIEIFGFSPSVYRCVPCINAKRLCEQKELGFMFISVADKVSSTGKPIVNPEIAKDLQQRLGVTNLLGVTMPQIFIDGQHIGGFDDFRAVAHTLI